MTLRGWRHFRPGWNAVMLGRVIAPVVVLVVLVLLVSSDPAE